MKQIGSGYNVVILSLYFVAMISINFIFFIVDFEFGVFVAFIFFSYFFFICKLRNVFISDNLLIVKDLIWRESSFSIDQIKNIGYVFHQYCYIELEGGKNVYFCIPSTKLFIKIADKLNSNKQKDYIEELLDLINTMRKV